MSAARPKTLTRDRRWWTRDRIVAALARFHREFGVAPTSSEAYQELQTKTGTGRYGPARPFPSCTTVLRVFPSFRVAWTAAGVDVDRGWEPWTPDEEAYIVASAGILPRSVVAADTGRSAPAIKRRLYDLGINTYSAQGWTLHHVERVAQIPRHVLDKYLDRGELPYLRGNKCLFVDPGDLLVIAEIDWEDPPEELELAVRRSLAQRMVKILDGQDWRAGRPYVAHKVTKTDRRWRPRLVRPTPRPDHVDAGDVVRLVRDVPSRGGATRGRVGKVTLIYWSQNNQQKGTTRERRDPQWFARVEFSKIKAHGNDQPRVTYTLPVDAIARESEPAEISERRRERAVTGSLLERIDRLLAELREVRDEIAELEEMRDRARAALEEAGLLKSAIGRTGVSN